MKLSALQISLAWLSVLRRNSLKPSAEPVGLIQIITPVQTSWSVRFADPQASDLSHNTPNTPGTILL